MDPVRNPFAPGAGSQPPELAGRDAIITDAQTALKRALIGKASRSQMLLGLRGVGKTVLLNKIEQDAAALGPRRASIIAKGMIYSPAHGDIAFTVPMFEDFLARHHLAL